MNKEFYIIAFSSTHAAIKAEKKLKDKFKVDIIPTPREISASCGISIKFGAEDFDSIIDIIKVDKDEISMYHIVSLGGRKEVMKIRMEDE